MSNLEKLGAAIISALDSHPAGDVLAILAGSLVSLSEEMIRRNGEDPSKQVTLKGGDGRRDITIHAKDQA